MALTEAIEEYVEKLFWFGEAGIEPTQANLARAMQVSQPSVTEMVRRLVDEGLVERDERKRLLFTRRGRAGREAHRVAPPPDRGLPGERVRDPVGRGARGGAHLRARGLAEPRAAHVREAPRRRRRARTATRSATPRARPARSWPPFRSARRSSCCGSRTRIPICSACSSARASSRATRSSCVALDGDEPRARDAARSHRAADRRGAVGVGVGRAARRRAARRGGGPRRGGAPHRRRLGSLTRSVDERRHASPGLF